MTRWSLILILFLSTAAALFAQSEPPTQEQFDDYHAKVGPLYETIFGTPYEPTEAQYFAENDIQAPGFYSGMNESGSLYDINITDIVFVDMSTYVAPSPFIAAQVATRDPNVGRFLGTLTGPAGSVTIFGHYFNFLDDTGTRIGRVVPSSLSPSDWPEATLNEPAPATPITLPAYFDGNLLFDPTPFPEIVLEAPTPTCIETTVWLDEFEVLDSFLGVSMSPECQACLADFDATIADINTLFKNLIEAAESNRDSAKADAKQALQDAIAQADADFEDDVRHIDDSFLFRWMWNPIDEATWVPTAEESFYLEASVAHTQIIEAARAVEMAACAAATGLFESIFQAAANDANDARAQAIQDRDACLAQHNCIVTCETRAYTYAIVKIDLTDLSVSLKDVQQIVVTVCP